MKARFPARGFLTRWHNLSAALVFFGFICLFVAFICLCVYCICNLSDVLWKPDFLQEVFLPCDIICLLGQFVWFGMSAYCIVMFVCCICLFVCLLYFLYLQFVWFPARGFLTRWHNLSAGLRKWHRQDCCGLIDDQKTLLPTLKKLYPLLVGIHWQLRNCQQKKF